MTREMQLVALVKAPSACTALELSDFVALVLAGGEVTPDGLPKRVKEAHSLAFIRGGDGLIGVAGLKFPIKNHRMDVSTSAGIDLPEGDFPLELGWVFVRPNARGGKSYPLCSALVNAVAEKGIFATSRANNTAMHSTLDKLGFKRAGDQWPSKQNGGNLTLFIKNAA